ncbi:helix-turn-helix domain-containing protein [Prauserella cavernicola]|uniref:Helix-turn-helix domain-containing protein n=1 Tax=Prauserella cavernicola TaxID=2800127 RepID=A0A934V3N6_9PSEU|nr:helix-turn-helix domain-containing protein [Prauserella cavernicola]MBK1784557.1 helix-turn-helix domain-containing protein [Prauserella cavernicola]
MDTTTPAAVPAKHLYRVTEAMRLLSMSRSVIYEEMRGGRLRFVKRGRSRLVPAVAIDSYVQLLIHETEEDIYGRAA